MNRRRQDVAASAARITRSRWVASAIGLLLTVLAGLTIAAPALAHGGGTPQLVDVPAGPLHIFAWSNPDPARVGPLHITVALVDPADGRPVMNADVRVQVTPLDVGSAAEAITTQATHAKATIKTYYETDLQMPAAGLWQVAIDYTADQGAGNANFDLAIQEKSSINWLLIGGSALVAVVLGWFFWPRSAAKA